MTQRTSASFLAAAIGVVVVVMACAAVGGVRAMGIDRAEIAAAERAESAAADAMELGMPTPPPPPYDSVMLEIEARIAEHEAADEQSAAQAAAKSKSKSSVEAVADAHARAKQMLRGQARTKAKTAERVRTHSRARAGDPFPDQPFTYKDVNSPPEWLVPEESAPAGPTTKPPPVPQMIPPPPPVPFPTYNYHDPNSAGPFSQYAPGVQGSGYDGGYNGPYDGFSMYGHPPNEAQGRGWMNPSIPRTAAQIAAATAASQYHPYGAPPPLYSMGSPPPDGAASWVPLGAFLQPNTLEGGAGEE